MPEFKASVRVMLKKSILDPQGRAVENTLKRLGHDNVSRLRVGKLIELTLSGDRAAIETQLEDLARNILSNPVMEEASITLEELEPS
ncbi:MAG TPA: phosphoribosylformylglycinamidine synthase subunit PurS [Trueperaceae bacterium]